MVPVSVRVLLGPGGGFRRPVFRTLSRGEDIRAGGTRKIAQKSHCNFQKEYCKYIYNILDFLTISL